MNMKKNSDFEIFSRGFFKENPTFVLLLGMCPTLAITTKVSSAIGMGLAATFVLVFSNLFISLLKDFIPEQVRIPSYIVIIASFVTIINLIIEAYLPALNKALGVFLPLIVVNCIILGRAEGFANKHTPYHSVLDGLGMGLGFTLAILIIATIREFFGTLKFDFEDLGFQTFKYITFLQDPDISIVKINNYDVIGGIKILTQPAGAFFVLGLILAFIQFVNIRKNRKKI